MRREVGGACWGKGEEEVRWEADVNLRELTET